MLKCLWEPPGEVPEGKYKNAPFGLFGPRRKNFHV